MRWQHYLLLPIQYLVGGIGMLLVFVGVPTASLVVLIAHYIFRYRKPSFTDDVIWVLTHVWFFCAGIRITVEGLENIQPSKPYMVVFNHTSLLDAPAVYHVVQQRGMLMRFLVKIEIFKIPIWGHALAAAGFIPVDRRRLPDAIQSYQHLKAAMARGMSFCVSPEGTRTKTGRLQDSFKKGPFITAVETQATILPIAFIGFNHVVPKGSLWPRGLQHVHAVVGPHISAAGYSLATQAQLSDRVYQWFVDVLPAEQQPLHPHT